MSDPWRRTPGLAFVSDILGEQIGAYIFPQTNAPVTANGTKFGRNEILSLYVYCKTQKHRSPRQCGSKLQHLFTIDAMSK